MFNNISLELLDNQVHSSNHYKQNIMKKYYLVIPDNGIFNDEAFKKTVSYKYEDKERAKQEAMKLAKQYPDKEFAIAEINELAKCSSFFHSLSNS